MITASNEHVFRSTDDPPVTIFINNGDVPVEYSDTEHIARWNWIGTPSTVAMARGVLPGAQPSIMRNGFLRFLVVVPVFEHG